MDIAKLAAPVRQLGRRSCLDIPCVIFDEVEWGAAAAVAHTAGATHRAFISGVVKLGSLWCHSIRWQQPTVILGLRRRATQTSRCTLIKIIVHKVDLQFEQGRMSRQEFF